MQNISRPVRALVGLVLIAAAAACGSTPGTPSAPTATPNAFGPGVIPTHVGADLAACLGGSRDSQCFNAVRLRASSVESSPVASAPLSLTFSVSGSTVSLSWTQSPIQDSPILSYILEAGSGPGQVNLANFNTGNPSTTLTVPGVPAGTYYVRVRAFNTSGASAPSNEVVITVGGIAPSCPSAPLNLVGSSPGIGLVSLQWAAPSSPASPSSYVIQAGSAPGRGDLANVDTGSTALSFTANNVPNGSYYVRVYSRSGCGLSGASNEILLTVSSTIPSGLFGVNLIVNGDAEAGAGSASGSDVIAAPGWTSSGNFTVIRYGAPQFPLQTDPGPANRGANFFAGGPDNDFSMSAQTVNVAAAATQIDRGRVAFQLSGYLGGFAGQEDNAVLSATFKSAANVGLGSTSIGPVTSTERGTSTGLLLRISAGLVPAGTRTVDVTLVMRRLSGSDNDGYADSLSLVFGQQ